jgi:hypothetical protein
LAEGYFSGVIEAAWELESGGTWNRRTGTRVRRIRDGQHDSRTLREKLRAS